MSILVVDDDYLVRMLTAGVLTDAGFKVVEASNTMEALRLFGDGVKFRAIVTDVEMPGPENGYGLAARARLTCPTVALLIISGRSPPKSSFLPSRARFLSKPTPAALLISELHHVIAANFSGGRTASVR